MSTSNWNAMRLKVSIVSKKNVQVRGPRRLPSSPMSFGGVSVHTIPCSFQYLRSARCPLSIFCPGNKRMPVPLVTPASLLSILSAGLRLPTGRRCREEMRGKTVNRATSATGTLLPRARFQTAPTVNVLRVSLQSSRQRAGVCVRRGCPVLHSDNRWLLHFHRMRIGWIGKIPSVRVRRELRLRRMRR